LLVFAGALVCVAPLAAAALDAGNRMPEVAAVDLAGKRIDRKALEGKVVLIDFWASWCAPCKQELPQLERLYRKHKDKGLVVIGVNVDSDVAKARALAAELKLSFPVVHDGDHKVAGRFEPPRMPSSYLVDRKGVVRYVHAGFRAGDEVEIEKQLKALLDAHE
jgi:peroxiredoxin